MLLVCQDFITTNKPILMFSLHITPGIEAGKVPLYKTWHWITYSVMLCEVRVAGKTMGYMYASCTIYWEPEGIGVCLKHVP